MRYIAKITITVCVFCSLSLCVFCLGTHTQLDAKAYAAAQGWISEANIFTDTRDGETYRTVTIGDKMWMAENLKFSTPGSRCYENGVSNCAQYGRLYDWDEAMSACPAGWRLPSSDDWDRLAVAVGGIRSEHSDEKTVIWDWAGQKLKSRTGWKKHGNITHGIGTDEFGFSAFPGGSWMIGREGNGSFHGIGGSGLWWSATETNGRGNDGLSVRCYIIHSWGSVLVSIVVTTDQQLGSIRCIQE
ncbi:MAG: fibrobacter succinogenes major paralogous domain-containing protein [Chitinispirillia bacterium]|nr:fibrobacter succinogenes major paralogous domain-containing protein [Chitinispirillia bacterium]